MNDIFIKHKRPLTRTAVDPLQRGRKVVLEGLDEAQAQFEAGDKKGKNYYEDGGDYFLKVAYGNMPVGGKNAVVAVGGLENLPTVIGEMRVHVEKGTFDKEILAIAESYAKRAA